jgi:hypothetical protein
MADQTCHGCKHCHYSAPDGQQWAKGCSNPPAILLQPHSRCTALGVYVPMVLGPAPEKKWIGSEVPRGCPQYQQPALFEM